MNKSDLKKIGYWHSKFEPELPDPKLYVDSAWDPEERASVIQYLRHGEVIACYWGMSRCRFCGASNGSKDLSDGVYVWPDGLAHYLEEHGVRPNQEFLDHIWKRAHDLS